MKRILLPTDFSTNSVNAIHYATKLFKNDACEFYLLNVFRLPYLESEEFMSQDIEKLTIMEDQMHDASREGMEKILNEITINEKHEFKTISDYNLFSLAVQQLVEEKEIELIVMGTKGATGAKEIFMGSNTGDIIMKNTCHVIAVPENHQYRIPKEILFPTDFRISYELKDLSPLIDLAKARDATVRIVYFSDKEALDDLQMKNKASLDNYLTAIKHYYYTLSNNDFEEGLNCFIQSRGDIDMIVIIAKHYSFFQRLLFKPKVRVLSFHTNIPLFVIHHLNK